MNKIKFIILSIFVFSNLYGGTDGTIRGQVVDADGAPLIGAQIYIESMGVGTTAGIDGNYILIGVPVGSSITCSKSAPATPVERSVNAVIFLSAILASPYLNPNYREFYCR